MFTGFALATAAPGFESGLGPLLHGSFFEFLSLIMNTLSKVRLKVNASCIYSWLAIL